MSERVEIRSDILLAHNAVDLRYVLLAGDYAGADLTIHPQRGERAETAFEAYGNAAAHGGYVMAKSYAEIIVSRGGFLVTMVGKSELNGTYGSWYQFYRLLGMLRIEGNDVIDHGHQNYLL